MLRTGILWMLLSLALSAFGQKPVLHLLMDQEPSQSLSDQSGKKNNAYLNGNLAFVPDRFGNDCRAIEFDGSSGYLSIPHDKSLSLSSSFTVSAWVMLPTGTRSQGLQWLTLVCKGENPQETAYSPAFRAQLTSATASVNTASTKTIGSIRQDFPMNRWFHVATVYDGYQLTIYADGREMGRYSLQDPIYANQEPLNIGRDIPGNKEFFKGMMDELKLFNDALTPAEVADLAQDQSSLGLGSACPGAPVQSPPAPPTNANPEGPIVPNFQQMQPRQNQPQNQPPPTQTPRRNLPKTLPLAQNQPTPAAPQTTRTNGTIPSREIRLRKSPSIQKKAKIPTQEATIFLYDHRAIDHDTVDIYLDGVMLIKGYEIQAFKHGETAVCSGDKSTY
ncbi:MAG: LamG domain-containing protein [Bacteroidota bacterium]